MQKTIDLVELDQILPSPTNPRKYFNEARLNELAASIKKVDVIQAITLRDYPGKPGMFEIVCGERRYRASKIAEKKTIRAEIRVLSDEEVQELQFIENIEREDVHPMDEAVTFKAMQENKKRVWLLEDIAAKINKPVTYVVQRLQLNSLIPEMQKEFWDEKFLIGHAILFARLTIADQKECFKATKKGGYYGTVHDTQEYIERNIMRQLSAAPFKRDDATLVVKCGAGACTTCFKRSGGANQLLFSDIKKDDRCFDKACFSEKKEAWLIREVEKILETAQDIVLVHYGYSGAKVPAEITKLSKQYAVRILEYSNSEIQNHSQSGYTEVKALWVSGSEAGHYKKMYRKLAGKAAATAKAAATGKVSVKDLDDQMDAIQQRLKRGNELDFEKVQEAIVTEIKNKFPEKKPLPGPMISVLDQRLFIAYLLFDEVNIWFNQELLKSLGLVEPKVPEDLFHVLLNLSQLQYDTIIKAILMKRFAAVYSECSKSQIIRKLAEALDINTAAFVEEQDIAKQKRIANANKKLDALGEQKDQLVKTKAAKTAKPAKPAAKSTSNAKKIAPGAKKVASTATATGSIADLIKEKDTAAA